MMQAVVMRRGMERYDGRGDVPEAVGAGGDRAGWRGRLTGERD